MMEIPWYTNQPTSRDRKNSYMTIRFTASGKRGDDSGDNVAQLGSTTQRPQDGVWKQHKNHRQWWEKQLGLFGRRKRAHTTCFITSFYRGQQARPVPDDDCALGSFKGYDIDRAARHGQMLLAIFLHVPTQLELLKRCMHCLDSPSSPQNNSRPPRRTLGSP